jgi:lysyl-tRNA synthetase class I
MEKVYFLNRATFQGDKDVYKAFYHTVKLFDSIACNNIQTITVLIPTLNQVRLLNILFDKSLLKQRKFTLQDIEFHIETPETYKAIPENEIILSIVVKPNVLEKLEEKSNFKFLVVVPQTMDEVLTYLKCHHAEDLESGDVLDVDNELDDRIIKAIEWLKETSHPNSGFTHPLDKDSLKGLSNAIANLNVPFEKETVIEYCINHAINLSSANKIAESFSKAKERLFKVTKPCYEFYLKVMTQRIEDYEV